MICYVTIIKGIYLTASCGVPVEFSVACRIAEWGVQFGQQGVTSGLNLGPVVTQAYIVIFH